MKANSDNKSRTISVTRRTVTELGSFGYHRASQVWFFADCAITPKGELVKPDKQGVFWVNHGEGCTGYTFRRNEREELVCGEGQEFVMGSPLMHPEVADEGDLSERWQELQEVVYETIGSLDGCIALGMMAAYAAMPELFAAESATPGLWLHGEQSQGKSTFARMMVRIWGFTREVGIPFNGSTAAKLRVALQQYSDLPLWLEEYQPGREPCRHELLKNIYDRSPGMKMDFGDKARDIQTTVVVTGVASCPDAQVNSRYAHVQVSQQRRMKDHQEWLRRESLRFYQFGRHWLLNRGRFVRLFRGHFQTWTEATERRSADARARMVYGVAYAGYAAASEMFAEVTEGGLARYRSYLEAFLPAREDMSKKPMKANSENKSRKRPVTRRTYEVTLGIRVELPADQRRGYTELNPGAHAYYSEAKIAPSRHRATSPARAVAMAAMYERVWLRPGVKFYRADVVPVVAAEGEPAQEGWNFFYAGDGNWFEDSCPF